MQMLMICEYLLPRALRLFGQGFASFIKAKKGLRGTLAARIVNKSDGFIKHLVSKLQINTCRSRYAIDYAFCIVYACTISSSWFRTTRGMQMVWSRWWRTCQVLIFGGNGSIRLLLVQDFILLFIRMSYHQKYFETVNKIIYKIHDFILEFYNSKLYVVLLVVYVMK
jgi:hypothetical protein